MNDNTGAVLKKIISINAMKNKNRFGKILIDKINDF